jgi:2-oxo-4-hydroxy-4-carboxy-5-ureidoimidazoline decarboxylase
MPLELDEFVQRYAGIYEHSAWVAEQGFARVADADNIEALAKIFSCCVDGATDEKKLALIRAHPDLAGKAAVSGQLTEESSEEQASAGIDQCTADEFAEFQVMNARYKEKFAFPFVMAVRDSNRQQILAGFVERLNNDADTEFARAISEIHKIARLRLQAMKKT